MLRSVTIREFLSDASNILILDGGLGTDLERLNCKVNEPLWSCTVLLDSPDLIAHIHESYLRAGARCIITSSYQATTYGLEKYRSMSRDEIAKVVAKSVQVAREAKERFFAAHEECRPVFICGSIGPYGAYLSDGSEYNGDYAHEVSVETFKDFHRLRIATLISSGVDILAIETQPSAKEVLAIVDLLENEFPLHSCWVSFTLNTNHPDTQIADGTPFEQIVPLLDKSNAVLAIGINCVPFEHTTSALKNISSFTTKPLVVYPNSPGNYDKITKTWIKSELSKKNEGTLAGMSETWINQGARLIGGCCHTTEKDIRELSKKLNKKTK